MPANQFFEPISKSKRKNRAKKFKDCVSTNIVNKSSSNNSRPFKVPNSATDQYRYSYFVRTVEEWNQLDNHIVTSGTVDLFKTKIQTFQCD